MQSEFHGTADPPDREPAQEIQGHRGPEGRRSPARDRRRGLDHRLQRLGQDHAPALRQHAGGVPPGPHPDRRRGDRLFRTAAQGAQGIGDRPPARHDRHGVPAVQPVPAHDGAAQRHPRPHQGEEAAGGGGECRRRKMAGASRPPGSPRSLSRPVVRRPAAARRHRPRRRDEPEGHAVRRGDLGARPGAGE